MRLIKNLILVMAAVFIYQPNYSQNGQVLKFVAYKYGTAKNIENKPILPFKWPNCNFQIVLNSADSTLDIYLPKKEHYHITHVLPVSQLEDRTMYVFSINDDQGQNCRAVFWYFPDERRDDEMLVFHPDVVEIFAIRLVN